MKQTLNSQRIRTPFETLLWRLVLAIAAVIVVLSCMAISNIQPRHPFPQFQLLATCICGILLFTIAIIGLLCRWGPLVPMSVITAVIFGVFIPPSLSSSAEEAVRNGFGRLFTGMFVGTIFGILINEYLNRKSVSDSDELQNY